MKKKFISFSKKENVIVKWGEEEIEVIPYIDAVVESTLIEEYIENYFNPKDNKLIKSMSWDFLGSEAGQKMSIIDRFTNISLKKEDGSDIDYIALLASGIWELVVEKIENYDKFRSDLFYVIESMEDEVFISKSIGATIDSFAKKIGEFLDKLNSFSPEEVKSLGEQGTKLLKDIENSPVSGLFKEAKRVSKSQKVQ